MAPAGLAGAVATPVDRYNLDAAGNVTVGDGTAALPAYSFLADPDTGFYRSGSGTVIFTSNNAIKMGWAPTYFSLVYDYSIMWNNPALNALDVGISRESAGVLQVNSGTISDYRDLKLRNLTASAAVAANSVRGSYSWLGTYNGGLGFVSMQTYGVQVGSVITSMSAGVGQICRILVNGSGPITLPSNVKFPPGTTWGTVQSMISMWTDSSTFWATVVPYNS